MKLKNNFELVNIGDETIAVPIDENGNYGFAISLNETGKYIFEQLKNEISIKDLIKNCINEFNGDEQDISIAVNDFVGTLIENNLLM